MSKEDTSVLQNIDEFEHRMIIRQNRQKSFFLVRIIFFFLVFATLLTYFISPLGYAKISSLKGNYYLNSSEVLQMSGISKKTHMLVIDEKVVESRLKENPRIKYADVEWTPFNLKISINEIVPIATTADNEIILSNGIKYDNYYSLYPTYNCPVDDLHLPKMLFTLSDKVSGNVESFLDSLKLLDKSHYQFVDYINITRSQENKLYYSIYLKTPDDNYLRVRTTIGIMEDVYRYDVISVLLKEYLRYGELKAQDEIQYRDAVCYLKNKTLTCARD